MVHLYLQAIVIGSVCWLKQVCVFMLGFDLIRGALLAYGRYSHTSQVRPLAGFLDAVLNSKRYLNHLKLAGRNGTSDQ